MINNINDTIKIQIRDVYTPLLKLNAKMFNVTVEKLDDNKYLIPEWNIQGDVITIQHWFYIKSLEKQQEYDRKLVEEYKKGNYDYVLERL